MKFWSTCWIIFLIIVCVEISYAQNNETTAPPTSDFQQWLQSNGYLDANPNNPAAATPNLPPDTVPPPPGAMAPVSTEQTVTTTTTSRSRHERSAIRPPLTYEESKQLMLESAPAAPPPTEDEKAAFSALLQQNMPLSPQQVVQLRQQIDMAQRAAAILPVVPPKPVSSTIMMNLAPGSTPPVIRLAQGYVSSIVFVDSTGAPWPIAAFDIGNPKNVNIQWDGKSNILLMQAVAPYGSGDIVFRLVGLPTPITLELISGQRVVDYRVDVHVPGLGPNAKDIPIGSGLPESANSLLLGVLDGVAPAGSKQLMVRGADGLAWVLGEKLYLRTRFTVLSPGWVSTMTSIDGMHAYELPKTSSVLISRYGEPFELRIEGY